MLQRDILNGCSVCLSITLVIHAHMVQDWSTFHTTRQSDVSSFLMWNFAVLSLRLHPEKKCYKEVLPIKMQKYWPMIHYNLEIVQDWK